VSNVQQYILVKHELGLGSPLTLPAGHETGCGDGAEIVPKWFLTDFALGQSPSS
jgi:hypothetical protein